ncbi:MAG: nuclear transport factor 2 family protein [Chitinophagaceae bacterium]|nr:nuclear transport factor 2 family protein [Chitinophagaceae bacterium]
MQIKSSLLFVFLLCFSSIALAQQKDSLGLTNIVLSLNKALIQKDERAIKRMVSKRIKFAHSNGWIETRKEMVDNLYNGTLSYIEIKLREINISINENVGIVQSKGKYTVMMKEHLYDFDLKATQVWQWKRGKWILMARQSVKIEQ